MENKLATCHELLIVVLCPPIFSVCNVRKWGFACHTGRRLIQTIRLLLMWGQIPSAGAYLTWMRPDSP